jgi:hypothetical protein
LPIATTTWLPPACAAVMPSGNVPAGVSGRSFTTRTTVPAVSNEVAGPSNISPSSSSWTKSIAKRSATCSGGATTTASRCPTSVGAVS